MVAQYTVFGRQVGSHYLAMATLGTTFALSYLAVGGRKAPAKQQTPPINASSSDEEAFIMEFLRNAENEDKKEKR